MNEAEKNYRENDRRKREYIHADGVPTFGRVDVTYGFNCMGCRKRKDGFRTRVFYRYEPKNNPDNGGRGQWNHYLGYVCSEICFQMVVMRLS